MTGAGSGGPAAGDAPRGPGDPYARVDYRRLIAWQRRIEREGPWLRGLLAAAPERSVLDLGCGTGEHVAFFADEGARAVGLDRSEAMIEAAREHEAAGRGRFVLGDMLDARAALGDEPPFGLVLSLGNALPHLASEAELHRLAATLRSVLRPGGTALVQLLNYRRILARGERHLPLDFRPAPEDDPSAAGAAAEEATAPDARREIVFLRLMRDVGDGRVLFFPTTLQLDPSAESPVSVVSSRCVPLRAWTDEDLVGILGAAGFDVTCHGDMQGGAFDAAGSRDLVLLACRR